MRLGERNRSDGRMFLRCKFCKAMLAHIDGVTVAQTADNMNLTTHVNALG